MNRAKLKLYAPQARRDFIQAVTDRAAYFGLTAKKVEPITEKADAVVIAGRAHPRKVADQRKALEERVRRDGFQRTMESLAYTWFNRLVAIRFLELHDYLETQNDVNGFLSNLRQELEKALANNARVQIR